MPKVLIVEDEYNIAYVLKMQLEQEHMLVDVVYKGNEALNRLRVQPYDLIILDWILPDIPGLEVCRQYRSRGGNSPILMLTGKGSIEEKAAGLDAGADDYLPKPFHPTELMARIRALLRRPAAMAPQVLRVRDLELDASTLQVTRAGCQIELTPKEMRILELLMRNPNKSFTPNAILARAWGSEALSSVETVRTHVKTLRRKLGDSEENPLIRTARGLGYRLVSNSSEADRSEVPSRFFT
ncbi:MAG TPA: response regulator transcription factor [Candidatus Obscuribacterales bacterium]